METNTENWKDHLQKGGSLMIVILGNILYALAVKLFLMPAGLLTGGTTGIGLALNRSFGIPVATFVLIFNVTMLLIGWKVMGRKFALTTVVVPSYIRLHWDFLRKSLEIWCLPRICFYVPSFPDWELAVL